MSNQPDPINITVTVDTENITEANKKLMVVFSQGLGGPVEDPGHPENYTSEVQKNQKLTWTAVAKNGQTPVFFQNVKHEDGKSIMKEIKRGNGHNVYVAKVRNDNSVNNNDEEEYSIMIGMAGYEGISGSNENGPIVYLGNQVAYMDSYQNNIWHIVPNAPFEIEGIAGYNTTGVIAYSGNQVAYMDDYSSGQWHMLSNAPFTIEGISGENSRGAIIYSGNQVAYMNSNANNVWTPLANAPFSIEGITGRNSDGVLAYAGNQVAYMPNYSNNQWISATNAPFDIEGISGSNTNGTVIYAGNRVCRSNNGVWTEVANAPFIIEGIAGNSTRGPIVFSGPQVQYMSNYTENAWHAVANMPFDTRSFTIDPRLKLKIDGSR
ncbi:hypothetical protein Q2T40_10520 [Winogradskyella maritima]|uniref:Uncharacterized protein n=1 Tax=Winogradskyella maritima TaxID=1517766 RepID=A0ABV8AN35_9FLAO|nr:hypothetical protein [Winogradskyella maritima]